MKPQDKIKEAMEATTIPSDGPFGMSDVNEPEKFKPNKVEEGQNENEVKID